MDITSPCKSLYYIIQNITYITKYPMDDWLTTFAFFKHQQLAYHHQSGTFTVDYFQF
jgi:hypothetical protein